MDNQLTAFRVCEAYIADNTNVMSNEAVLSLRGAIRGRDWMTLIRKSSDLEENSKSLEERRVYRQIGAFFKKNVTFRHAGTTELAANLAFQRGERLCRITNKRLDHFYSKQDRLDPDLRLMIEAAERYIRNVLGDFDAFQENIPFLLKVTAGATACFKREESIPFMRFRRRMDVSPRCRPYLDAAYRFYGYAVPKIQYVPWNRLTTVPKNCRTDRMIACEPVGNVPFQLAFDQYVKGRLRSRGIDLSDQSQNRAFARRGSIDGTFSTIDLSMASDTMSINTVSWLLPEPWFQYLNDIRCTHYSFNGEPPKNDHDGLTYGRYAKFSSMGNGATFALETLLFASFAYAAGNTRPCVYGDDIIAARGTEERLFKLLRFFGFVPNLEKSFTDGPFRESCGGDYYDGEDITPFYIRDEAGWNLPNLCHNINGLMAISPYGELWKYLADITVARNLPRVPWNENSTSGVYVTPHHAYQRNILRVNRSSGSLETLMYQGKTRTVVCEDSRALTLWFLRKQAHENSVVIASRHTTSDTKYRRKWTNWHMPAMGAPANLFGWSDLIFPL